MTSKDEALKMAIEFMETLTIDVGIKTWNEKHRKEAIQACKEALAQPSVAQLNDEYFRDTHVEGLQPAREPVAWMQEDGSHNYISNFAKKNNPLFVYKDYTTPLYTHPAPSCKCEECGMKYCECGERK